MNDKNNTADTTASARIDTPKPRPAQPYTIGELLRLYDTCKGDWCAIARAVERYYITELDALSASLAPVSAQQADSRAPAPADEQALDLYDEIECDLNYLFGRASKEGHDAGQALAEQVKAKMQRARAAHQAALAQPSAAPNQDWQTLAQEHEGRYRVEHKVFGCFEVKCGTGTRTLYATKFGRRDAELIAAELTTAFNDGLYVGSQAAPTSDQQAGAVANQLLLDVAALLRPLVSDGKAIRIKDARRVLQQVNAARTAAAPVPVEQAGAQPVAQAAPIMAPCEGGPLLPDSCSDCRREGGLCELVTGRDLAAPTPATGQSLYTCIGKGGKYELLGKAKGAGLSESVTVTVYRDVETGQMYYRMPGNFDARMQPLAATPVTDQPKQGDA